MAEATSNEVLGAAAKYETEQKMYQAMAEKMQADGLDVTAAEIGELVEAQQQNDSFEPSEKEEEIIEKWPNIRRSMTGKMRHMLFVGHCCAAGMDLIAGD